MTRIQQEILTKARGYEKETIMTTNYANYTKRDEIRRITDGTDSLTRNPELSCQPQRSRRGAEERNGNPEIWNRR